MKLYEIVGKDALARKRRLLFAAFGIVIGMMTAVGILTVARSGKAQTFLNSLVNSVSTRTEAYRVW